MIKFNYSREESKHLLFTSDTHFWHTNILKYCNRSYSIIEEMNNDLIKRWNNKVNQNDLVFHLGDFCFCGATKAKEILEQLNGKIILVKGNHDYKSTLKLFDEVYPQLHLTIDGKQVLLNHYPFLCFSADYQLFGHIHSRGNVSEDNIRFQNYGLPNQYDVGVDNNNYTPISWLELLNKFHANKQDSDEN